MTLNEPSVSVIVSMYNNAEVLQQTLESALRQSLFNLEVILIDGGSQDSSLTVANRMAAEDSRVRVIAQENLSEGAARNLGLKAASGSYVSFLDPEDCYPDSNVLRDLLNVVETTGLSVAGGHFCGMSRDPFAEANSQIGSEPHLTDYVTMRYAKYQHSSGFHQFIFDRRFLADNEIAFPDYRRFSEHPFFVQALSKASEFATLNRATYTYNAKPDAPPDAEATLDGLRAIIDVLNTAEAHGYEVLKVRTLQRFRSTDLQQTLSTPLKKDPRTTLPLLESIARFALIRDSSISESERSPSDISRTSVRTNVDVTVVIPVHNAAAWLHECLLSVLGQSRVSAEIICVNDGSTDDSLRILHEYRSYSPDRIQVVNQPNRGLSVARNVGIDAANGRYVCMLDSDDYWRVDGLHLLVNRADSEELDVLQFDTIPFPDGEVEEHIWKTYSTYYKRPGQPTGVMKGSDLLGMQRKSSAYKPNAGLYLARRSLLVQHQLRFIPGIMHEDNPFTFALMLNAQRVAHEALNFHARRVRPGSIMTSSSVERSMRGYFASYLHMREESARHSFDLDLAKTVGLTLYGILNNVSSRLMKVDDAAAERLADFVSTADAQQTYSVLMRMRQLELKLAAFTNSQKE